MSKRFVVFLVSMVGLCIGLGTNYWFAQETYTQEDLDQVVIRFCDKVGDLDLQKTIYIGTWETGKLRFCVYNQSAKEIPVKYTFTTAAYNSVGNRTCGNDELVLIPKQDSRTISLPPFQMIMINEEIVVPPGMKWYQMGCLTAEVGVNEAIDLWGMFFLTMRKAFDFDIMIGGMADVQSKITILPTTGGIFSTNKQIKAQIDEENHLHLSFLVQNEGNVIQNMIVTGKVYNSLWFEKEFSIDPTSIQPKTIGEMTTDVWLLPSYKWLFSVKFTIQNQPQFMFEIEDEKMKQIWSITQEATLFAFSWIIVAILLAALLLLYKIFAPKRKKTEVVSIPPNNVQTPVVNW